MTFWEKILTLFRGYGQDEATLLAWSAQVLSPGEQRILKNNVARGRTTLTPMTLRVPGTHVTYPRAGGEGSTALNTTFREHAFQHAFTAFSAHAYEAVSNAIAPEMLGLEDVKRAAALQLFADERLHILLLGDPGTGKTEVLRASEQLAVKSSMGLGSGTSRAGLSVAYHKGEIHKGLLVQADGGICCIDELNLMKKEDRASLYNAMEKGFVSFDKAGMHEQFSADVRIIATANPKGDRFIGEDVQELRKQLPFDPALLSRFHLVFLIRKPGVEEFTKIAKSIGRSTKKRAQDNAFYHAYVRHASTITAEFPATLEPRVTEAATRIKEREADFLIEVSPRIVKGIIGFAKASARMELRDTVTEEDVERVLELFGSSLGVQLHR